MWCWKYNDEDDDDGGGELLLSRSYRALDKSMRLWKDSQGREHI